MTLNISYAQIPDFLDLCKLILNASSMWLKIDNHCSLYQEIRKNGKFGVDPEVYTIKLSW